MGRLKIRQEDNSKEVVAYISDVQPLADDLDDLTVDVNDLAGTDRTTETVKGNADDIIDLAGEGRTTETVKGNADQIKALETQLDTTSENLSGAINDLNDKVDINKAEFEQNRQETQLKTAKVEKELNDFKNTLQQVNVNQEAKQSTSGYGTISLPKNAANGQVSGVVRGLTATNLIKNGNFSKDADGDGLADGFEVGEDVISTRIENNTQFWLTDTLTSWRGRLHYEFDHPLRLEHRYYIKFIGNNIQIVHFYDQAILPIGEYNGIISSIFTPEQNDENYIQIRPFQAGAESSIKEFMVINLTQTFGEGNEPTKEECDKIFTNWFDGTKSTISAMRTTSENEDKTEKSQAYIIAKDKDNKIVNLRSLPNGTKDEIRVSGGKAEHIKRVSDEVQLKDLAWEISAGETTNYWAVRFTPYLHSGITSLNQINLLNYAGLGYTSYDYWETLNDYGFWLSDKSGQVRFKIPKSEIVGTIDNIKAKTWFESKQATLTYQLAEPEIIPIQVSGNIVSNPGGTIYIEPAVVDANVYNNGITIFEQELNIDYIDKLYKIDYQTGVKTEIDASKAVIAEDKKSFTHPDLVNGDMVFFEYYYSNETTQGETTIEYYDSRYVIPDKTLPNKFYKWDIEVDNGVPSVAVTEV